LAHGLAVVFVRGDRAARGRRGRPAGPARAAAPAVVRRGPVRAPEGAGAAPGPARPRRPDPRGGGGARGPARRGAARGGGGAGGGSAPVRARHAAPAVTRALQDLAACAAVDVVIVARGGGSLADLFAFCDETLCRTVALLRVPVIASVGHHTDRTLLDDVAAVACSTPTHAAEAAVPLDCRAAVARLAATAARLDRASRPGATARAPV